jgi:hypothetical protein
MKKSNIDNFWFYVKFYRYWKKKKYTIISDTVFNKNKQLIGYGGENALKAFLMYEGKGVIPTHSQQPRLLESAILGKKIINFQIKQWAEGLNDCGGFGHLIEIGEEFYNEGIKLPEWVWWAVWKQSKKYVEG